MLSTHSKDVPGYPFGSVVQYVTDAAGTPVLLISRLAQHTQNLADNPRAALTVVAGHDGNVQEAARLTWMGEATRLVAPDAALVARHARYFPATRDYLQMDFEFWRIGLHKARFIGGFGRIHWVAPERLAAENPFAGEAEASMVAHMNEDHVAAMRTYCAEAGIDCPVDPQMAGVDPLGFHLRIAERLVRFEFASRAANPGQVRQQLVAMARPRESG